MALFEPISMGGIQLRNRIVMAPMTRTRSTQPGDIPNDLMATYYLQRATAGLIITEAAHISKLGQAYAATPGIYTAEQIAGWKQITDTVHSAGSKIFVQLWHCGRVSHQILTGGLQPISASSLVARSVKVFVINEQGQHEFVSSETPRPMTHDDIKTVVVDFKQAAQNALDAGFDGVELHAANGYLINQFIDSGTNKRTDEYGGSLENRMRLLRECLDAVVSVMGPDRVGVRVSPFGTKNDAYDSDPATTYLEVAKLLNSRKVVYMHIVDTDNTDDEFRNCMRSTFDSKIIYTGDYDYAKGTAAVQYGYADCIGFGRLYIANPDLVERMQHKYPMATVDYRTWYDGGPKGYVDYPVYCNPGSEV